MHNSRCMCGADVPQNGSAPEIIEVEKSLAVDIQADGQDNFILGEASHACMDKLTWRQSCQETFWGSTL